MKFADLDLWATGIYLKILKIVVHTINYNLRKFHIDRSKLSPLGPKNKRIFANFAELNLWAIDLNFLHIVVNFRLIVQKLSHVKPKDKEIFAKFADLD